MVQPDQLCVRMPPPLDVSSRDFLAADWPAQAVRADLQEDLDVVVRGAEQLDEDLRKGTRLSVNVDRLPSPHNLRWVPNANRRTAKSLKCLWSVCYRTDGEVCGQMPSIIIATNSRATFSVMALGGELVERRPDAPAQAVLMVQVAKEEMAEERAKRLERRGTRAAFA